MATAPICTRICTGFRVNGLHRQKIREDLRKRRLRVNHIVIAANFQQIRVFLWAPAELPFSSHVFNQLSSVHKGYRELFCVEREQLIMKRKTLEVQHTFWQMFSPLSYIWSGKSWSSPKAGFQQRRSRKRSRKSDYDGENRSRKRSHKRGGIGLRRIRTFPFRLYLLTTPSLTFRLWSGEQIVGVGSRIGRIKQSQCTFPRFVIGWFSSSASASYADNLVFTRKRSDRNAVFTRFQIRLRR